MNARYYALELIPGSEGRGTLRFELENASDFTWHSAEGFTAGYQVFDPPSGALLSEGERATLPAEFPAGSRTRVELRIALPREAGSYRIYISPLHENHAWAHERGLPFILADIRVTAGETFEVSALRVTDLSGLKRARFVRAIPRALWMPFETIWRNRSLSHVLVKREILSRSRGSFFGSTWTILNPLLLMATYFFVFGLVLKSRFGNDPSPASFALYFLAGMLPWLAFSEAAGRAPGLMIEYRQLIRKLVFPIEMLPVNLVFSGLVGEAFGLVLFALAFLAIRHHLPWALIYLPVLLIPQMLFTLAICWFMSALGAFLRDLVQVNGFLMTLWFFVTPICYPETQIPSEARWLLTKNPLYTLVRAYRSIFLENHAPDWRALGTLTAFSLALAILSHAWFYKLKKSFADVL